MHEETFWRQIPLRKPGSDPLNSSASAPAPRRYQSSAKLGASSGRIILFGGVGARKDAAAYNDVWELSYDSNEDEYSFRMLLESKASDDIICPAGRYSHSAVGLDEDRMLIFGGCNRDGHAFNDTWVYQYSSNSWREIPNDSSYTPAARYNHAMVPITLNNETNPSYLVIYGGSTGKKSYADDFWLYDVKAEAWSKLELKLGEDLLAGGENELIMNRAGHLMSHIPGGEYDQLLVYGGYTGDGGFDQLADTFKASLNIENRVIENFEKIVTSGTAPYTARPIVYSKCPSTGNIYVFGGYDGKVPSFELNELGAGLRWRPIKLWMEMDQASIMKSTTNNSMTHPVSRYGHCSEISWRNDPNSPNSKIPVMLIFGGSGSMLLRDLVEIEMFE